MNMNLFFRVFFDAAVHLFWFFYGLPVACLAWFIVMLILNLRTPKENEARKKKLRVLTLVSGIVTLALAVASTSMLIFLSIGLMNM